MFSTFKLTEETAAPQSTLKPFPSDGTRGSLVSRACQPCRERKIRCSGSLPCRACQWYRRSTECHYTDAKARANARRSRKRTSKPSQSQHDILQILFPGVSRTRLNGLSRNELISLIPNDGPSDLSQSPSSRVSKPNENRNRPLVESPDAADLAALQVIPEQDIVAHVRKCTPHTDIQDDLGALMFSLKQPSSYLGISSVVAALRVIDRLHPGLHEMLLREKESIVTQKQQISDPPSPAPTSPELSPQDHLTPEIGGTISAWDDIPLINSFFANFHPFIPLIDESSFRHSYLQNQRTDNRWMLLLSVVLAVGKLAARPTHVAEHKLLYARIKRYLTIDILDVPHLETIQALAILGGFYLHYLQLPILANSLMGATLRLANVLCLHREYPESFLVGIKAADKTIMLETRRRIWWCLYILEAWSGISLGRANSGLFGSEVTTKHPQEPIGISNEMLRLLQDNIQFCFISTKMEQALAVSPLIRDEERTALDTAFETCYQASVVQEGMTKSKPSQPPGLSSARNVTRWRYKWARILLHRPILLWHTISKTAIVDMSEGKKYAIRLCRELTCDLIKDISPTWNSQNHSVMEAWGATWHLYQAAMVPVLALFSDFQDKLLLADCVAQVELAKTTLSSLQDHVTSASPSLETISLLYEVSKRRSIRNAIPESQIENVSAKLPECGLPMTLTGQDTEWENYGRTQNGFYLIDPEATMDGLFSTLDWNQFFSHSYDYNNMLGAEREL